MKRYSSLFVGLTLAASLAGCGNSGGNPPGNQDMAGGGGGGDMATPPKVDMAIGNGPCLNGNPGCTGDPCTVTKDCAKGLFGASQAAQCLKSVNGITYEGGSCTSGCRPSQNKQENNFINPDCPGGAAVCAGNGTSGQCTPICTGAPDCREKYVCAFTTGTPAAGCIPIGASTCDPDMDPRPQGKTCPMGQRCVSYSPDNSYGQCADVCDPIAQNCAPPMMGTNGCVVDLHSADGSGECINVNGGAEGDPCIFLNDCAAGMMCFAQKCRQFCRTGDVDAGAKGCPGGQTCKDIKLSGIMIKFTAAKTGICSP